MIPVNRVLNIKGSENSVEVKIDQTTEEIQVKLDNPQEGFKIIRKIVNIITIIQRKIVKIQIQTAIKH